jgi:O-acetyl-ADP-ribose deacetylase (regulator of RNase III)
MHAIIGKSKINLVLGDITEQNTDAVVNAANSSLMGGGGVDGAIHSKGGPAILEECKILRKTTWKDGLLPGEATITTGGRLKAKKVIHTVGPVWSGGRKGEAQLLENSYFHSLLLALKMEIKTISFPSISTGAYGYPIEEASRIALNTVIEFLKNLEGIEEVRFVLHSRKDLQTYEEALAEITDL